VTIEERYRKLRRAIAPERAAWVYACPEFGMLAVDVTYLCEMCGSTMRRPAEHEQAP
jgi:predicted RNA-binding Zn-ribbon protein involved in translation (DUF1610 family)